MLEANKIDAKNVLVEELSIADIKDAIKKSKSLFEFISKDNKDFLWIDIFNAPEEKLSDEELTIMQDVLKIHPLVIEDCLAPKHLPKAEAYNGYSFLIINKMLSKQQEELESCKISFVIGENYVLTYRHNHIREVDAVKNQFKLKKQELKSPIDIFYLITDKVIDDYVDIIDAFTTEIYDIEEVVFDKPNSSLILKDINFIRKNLIILRRNALIQKQIFSDIIDGNISGLDIGKRSFYFKDICDHLDRILAKIDNQKEHISGILNIQVGLSSQKLNNLVKFLTIISAVLLPATLLASIFGMNFAKMPLLNVDNGFFITLAIMSTFGITTFVFFYNKRWL